ncbi:MAG: polymerase protein [Candidatus Moranbacteria bacterium GW2011_GWF1_44_4]|nr:MAG: polymerase protein [Candidatus Moranbacteria bacterium GW2011_GWF1_44_4]
MAAFIEKIKDEARRDGWVQTLFGRKRYLPQIYSEAEYIRGEAERMAVNAPIQGSEADVVKLGMIRSQDLIEKKFKGQAFQLLQIHDELLFEVKKELVPEFVFEIKKILEEIYPHEIKLEVQAKTGPSWGELEEYAMVGKGK